MRLRLRHLPVPVLLAGVLAGCGSSANTVTRGGSATRTVTRTVTGGTPSSSSTASVSSTSASTSRAAPAAAGDLCRAGELSGSFLGGEGATGHGALGFALTNTSHSSCRTFGYPGVLLLAASGAPLPTHPTRTTDDFFGTTSERAITLAPGASASFRLGVLHIGQDGSNRGCTTAHALQVIPPNDTGTLRVAIGSGGAFECDGTVSVTPLQAGRGALRG